MPGNEELSQSVGKSKQEGEDSLTVKEPAPAKAPAESWMRKMSRHLWWRAHWLAPNRIPAPHANKAYQQNRDKELNDASRIDDGEELRVRAVWGVELFGPNESDRLYEALAVLGWQAGFGMMEDGALTWVQQQRAYGHGGSYNVGAVTRSTNQSRFLGVRNHASLPDGVEYLLVRIHQIVPAVTCVVVCFVLNDDVAACFEREINLERRSRIQRGPHWSVSHWGPSHLKEQAIEAVRSQVRRGISSWFERNLPGYFASSSQPQRFPTAELISTKLGDLFSQPKPKLYFDWRRIVANAAPHEVWTSKDLPGLQFVLRRARWPRERDNSLVVSVSLRALPEDRVQFYGGGAEASVAICHEALEGTLAYFAVAAFIAEVGRDLKVTREDLDLSAANRKTLHTINRIQRFFDRNAGVPTAARELRDATKRPGLLEHDCESFKATPWSKDEPSREFAKVLQEQVHIAATALVEEESSTREHFQQLATLMSIRESIRTQRRMEILTIAALLVAAVTFAAAVPDNWTAKLKVLFADIWTAEHVTPNHRTY